jgi:heme/copper-type cytochrome/quinol oxidase subunit 1
VFPLFGAFYYWFPKVSGRMMSERLGQWNFWLFFVGFNVAFYPMHHLGLQGMPRRVYTYPEGMGWGTLNLVSTIGAATIAISVLVFVVNAVASWRRGAPAGANPWNASTLEWATASPPPAYNFDDIPLVHARDPLWEPAPADAERPVRVTGLSEKTREVLITTVLDAEPNHRLVFPDPSIWPFVSAITVTAMFIGTIFTPWAFAAGAVPIAIAVTAWFWPNREEIEEALALEKRP